MTNFIMYLFTKDLRRLAGLLFFWVLILGFKTYLISAGVYAFRDNFEFQMFQPMLVQLFNFLSALFIILLVPLIVQDEPLVSTTAFWLTRPLSRTRVLSTKILFIMIFLVLIPMIVETGTLFLNHIPNNFIILDVLEILLTGIAFIMPFFLLSSLTSRFTGYALGGVIAVAVYIVWSILQMILLFLWPAFKTMLYAHSYDKFLNQSLQHSTSVVEQGLYILLFGGLIIHQYVTRNTARTIRWTVVSGFLILMIGHVWNIDFLKVEKDRASKIEIIPGHIKIHFDFDHAEVADGVTYTHADEGYKIIRSKLVIEGLPDNVFAKIDTKSSVELRFPDGKRVNAGSFNPPEYFDLSDASLMKPLQAAMGEFIVKNPVVNGFQYGEIAQMKKDDFEKFKGKSSTYAVDATMKIYKFEVISQLPLSTGAKAFGGNKQVEIFKTITKPQMFSVVTIERVLNMLFDRKNEKSSDFGHASAGPLEVFLLRNKKTKEIILPESKGQIDIFKTQDTFNNGLRLKVYANQYDFNLLAAGVSQEWLKDAELIRVGIKWQGNIPFNIRIKDFVLPSKTTDINPEAHYSSEASLKIQQHNMLMTGAK